MDKGNVLAMYDVRGIQDYVYRTAKVQDAIGASAIVEFIIGDALRYGIREYEKEHNCSLTTVLEWEKNGEPVPYEDKGEDVQVYYIGGGNALVGFRDEQLSSAVNRKMSYYVLDRTYSLQLAVAVVPKTDNYACDYKNIFDEMANVKAEMQESRLLGALPVQRIEIKTGLPVSRNIPAGISGQGPASRETYLKKLSEKKVRDLVERARKFDTYIEGKGIDSTLAVIHIDGNNMGLRIRRLIGGIQDYAEAVDTMRSISCRINYSYKDTYQSMEKLFNAADPDSMLKILTAGDDITYVCKGKLALASVEYFSREISKKSMNGSEDPDSLAAYGFSVCAGIAYMGSHFPFSVGYETAEKCCDSAKSAAKDISNMLTVKINGEDWQRIGNWVDFQFCKNIQTADLDNSRHNEFITRSGEQLLLRPYELPLLHKADREKAENRWENLTYNLEYFMNSSEEEKPGVNLPRSFAKQLRNTYSSGGAAVNGLASFLKSRGWKMPDGTTDMFTADREALWYDALELMDMYIPLSKVEHQGQQNEGKEQ